MKLAFLAVLLVFLVLPLARASVGLGVNDYDVKQVVTGPSIIPVGKVTNIGNETLALSFVWIQTNSTVNMTLPVSSGANFTIEPGQSFEIAIASNMSTATVSSYVGNYSGIVEIKGSYTAQGEGNQVVPGVECHITLIINDPSEQNKQYNARLLVVSLICIIAIVLGLAVLIVKLKKRHAIPSGPFRGKLDMWTRKFRR